MSLVELLVAIGLLMLVFGGLMTSFQIIVTLIGSAKAQAGALALANEKIEYIRSLSYDTVGTIAGIPNGPLPQISTTSLNGILYTERLLIGYIDDAADGEGASDINGILADYKLVKVEYSWVDKGSPKTISLISNIVPRGIETTAGGGTLTVNVFNANTDPVAGASVRVYNDTGTTTIDTIRYTNSAGIAMFSGAPALSNYEITVTDTGYSTDQTYSASTTNPNPLTPHVAVLESEVSTMNFQIDELSDLSVQTLGLPTLGEFEDLFNDATTIATSTNTALASGAVRLSGSSGSYPPSGMLFSNGVNPGTLKSWETLSYEATLPAATDVLVRVYSRTGTTTLTLIPDADLPGNSAGFAAGSVNLTALDVSTYGEIALGAVLSSSDTAVTPVLSMWKITYKETQSQIASIPFKMTSSKTIGTDISALPIYKYQKSFTTDASGDRSIADLEWGVYDVEVTSAAYDIAEACENVPYSLDPAVNETLSLTLAPATTYSLRVAVYDSAGEVIPNAEVTISRPGYNRSIYTSACGQGFFNSGLSSALDYTLNVQAFGYTSQTISDVAVEGTQTYAVTLVES